MILNCWLNRRSKEERALFAHADWLIAVCHSNIGDVNGQKDSETAKTNIHQTAKLATYADKQKSVLLGKVIKGT